MSVFSLNPKVDGQVTTEVLDDVAKNLNIKIKDEEKEDYRILLAIFDENAQDVMGMPDYVPPTDLDRFPRKDIHEMPKEKNTHGAWAWCCSIKDSEPNNGPLAGKTIALKDMISVKDVPMLIGTEVIKDFVPDLDATVTTRVLEAGSHILGKTVCENLCHSGFSHSSYPGPVDNPYAKGYSAGGSSSGSGVLVALGEVDLSIGADQGGSVRIPAAHCGIVGFKPTFGLIPYTGCASNEATYDHLGPMTRTVLDNALLLQVIAGNDNIDDRSFAAPSPAHLPKYYDQLKSLNNPKDLSGTKIGIITESLDQRELDPRVKECFLKAAENFRKLGATVEDVSIPIHKQAPSIWAPVSKISGYLAKVYGTIGRRGHVMHELNSLLKNALREQATWDKAFVTSKNVMLNGAYADQKYPTLLAKATNLGRKVRDEYDHALTKYDVLITPTLPFVATSHAPPDAPLMEHIKKQIGLTNNICPFNQTGHPALSIPMGMLPPLEGPAVGQEGVKLPVSLQIVGRWWDEEKIFRIAYAWEQSCDWKTLG